MNVLGMFARKDDIWLSLAGAILLMTVTGVALANAQSLSQAWGIIVLMIIFGIVYSRMPDPDTSVPKSLRQVYAYLVTLTLLASWAAIFLSLAFTVLFFVISVSAMLFLPTKEALAWIVVFTTICAVAYVFREGWAIGLLSAAIQGTGFVFFGTFGLALKRAKTASQESQRLLGELQSAHQQLQTYAQQIETLAVAEERNRLSRDLHDTLGHRLTVSLVQLEGAERLVSQEPQRAVEIIHTARQQLNEGLSEVRQTVAMLRTPLVTDLSLPKGLKQLVQNFGQATTLDISTRLPDTLPPLTDSYRLALYRVAQEALTNIQRHAQATSAQLSLEVTPDLINLSIQDNGVGLPAENGHNPGFGLRGMQERAVQLGGNLQVTSNSGTGTQLIFTLPRTLSNNTQQKSQETVHGPADSHPRSPS